MLKAVFKTVKVTEKTDVSKLPLFSQIGILFGKVSNSEENEMIARERVSKEKLKLSSNLYSMIKEAIRVMRKRNETSVTLRISSVFKPFLNEITDENMGFGKFYDIRVIDKGALVKGSNYFVIVTIKEK